MSKPSRRMMSSLAIGTAAAATIAQFMPGAALAAAQHTSLSAPAAGTDPTPEPSASGGPTPAASAAGSQIATLRPAVVTTTAPTGCTYSSSPDYGCGKLTVQAQPVASTFPGGSTPELGGLTFDITGPAAENDTVTDDQLGTCDTTADADDSNATCTESKVPNISNFNASWVEGDQYSFVLDAATPPPANTVVPKAITGAFPNCTAYQNASASPSGCPDTVPFLVYGAYHKVGLRIVNSVTHKPVANAEYELCTPTTGPPQTGKAGCPSGSTQIVAATSNSQGRLVFPSVYLGSNNYSVAPIKVPRGYKSAGSQRLQLPAVTTTSEAGQLVQGAAKLAPIRPTVKTDHLTTREGKSVTFNPLKGAKAVVGPLKLIKVGKVSHGSVRIKHGKIRFTPKRQFVGKITFTYTARNGVGATATGRVVLHVKPTP